MKRFKIYLLALVVLMGLAIASCTEKEEEFIDSIPPEFFVESPVENDTIMLGGVLQLKCMFSDNDFLSSYGISIAGTEGQAWSYSKTENAAEGEDVIIVDLTIDVPAEEEVQNAGAYKLVYWAKDLQENADSVIINFVLEELPPSSFADDFSNAIDFLTADLSNTIWDGFLINSGTASEQNAEVVQANSTANPGGLTIETVNCGWEGGHDDGFLLYKNVPGGTDFEVQMKITGGDFASLGGTVVNYLTAGLMVKPAGATNLFTCSNAFDRPEWGVVVGLRDIYNGVQNDTWDAENKTGLSQTPWLKLSKVGKVVTAYKSADGSAWSVMGSATHDEYEAADLQVGIAHATFTGEAGKAVFDDFKLTYLD